MPPYRSIEIFSDASLSKQIAWLDGIVETTSFTGNSPDVLRIVSKHGSRDYVMPKLVSIGDAGFVFRAFEQGASGVSGGAVERFFLIY